MFLDGETLNIWLPNWNKKREWMGIVVGRKVFIYLGWYTILAVVNGFHEELSAEHFGNTGLQQLIISYRKSQSCAETCQFHTNNSLNMEFIDHTSCVVFNGKYSTHPMCSENLGSNMQWSNTRGQYGKMHQPHCPERDPNFKVHEFKVLRWITDSLNTIKNPKTCEYQYIIPTVVW